MPISWVKKYNVKKGDELELTQDGKAIAISTEGGLEPKKVDVDVSGLLPRLADRFLARAYQKGYDEVNIRFDNQELLNAIQNKVTELIGFEIMDKSKNSIKIKTIASKLDIDFDIALRKAFFMILEMAKSTLISYKKGDKETLKNIYKMDLDVNRYCYFCLRAINKNFREGFGSHILYYLIESLEDLGDEYKALASNLAKIKQNKDIINVLEESNDIVILAYEFFYKPSKKIGAKAYLNYKKISKLIEEKMHSKNEVENIIYMQLHKIINIAYHFPTMRLDTLKELGG